MVSRKATALFGTNCGMKEKRSATLFFMSEFLLQQPRGLRRTPRLT
jgi:hypothetical protein